MMKVSSKSGRQEQSKFGRLFYDKSIIQKWKTRTIQIWMIVLWWKYHPKVEDLNHPNVDHYYSFWSLYRKMRHFHPLLDWNIMWVKSFRKWMTIGPQFPSIFGSGTYLADALITWLCWTHTQTQVYIIYMHARTHALTHTYYTYIPTQMV